MNLHDKRFRHELKYYLHIFDYLSLRQKVSSVLTIDKNSQTHEGYGIRSLYFDGIHNHSLYDKNNGVFNREKYRIRIYNGSDKKISLERKSKFGDFISKESAPMTRAEYDAILIGNIDVLSGKDQPLIKDFYAALKYRNFLPTVIVDYVREAYVYELGNVRITFDKKMSAAVNTIDLFDPNLMLEEPLLPEQTILEVKFDQFLPDNIRQLVQPERFVRSAISKYVICREVNIKHFK
ncbi:polyphosphate polymerase domain-containing protein [Psychrobacillus psychrodurans]|uniref:Polyphosphate polymerase domain-containing protein n=1 Tax=Psychrobacillus psychrodurans TaxID=126157 RepID=A0A9X3L801_9BACI|nr:polyphosphate polymerase domain-containing protein [Psychrobacillus psychrodurans]MCZ8533021.1 polyphosphate polymerase domain-containing protein [Psychrobacillus psychrodurans]